MHILVAAALAGISRYAHAINTVKMAQGFAKCGHDVTLLCRRARGGAVSASEFAEHYGLSQDLRIIQLPNWIGKDRLFALWAQLSVRSRRPDLIYARNYALPWLSSRLGFPTVAESHAHPGNTSRPFLRFVRGVRNSHFRLLVTISEHLAENFRSLGVPHEKILVLPDAVDMDQFARPKVLPPNPYCKDAPCAVYTGHLYDYKGIPTILGAAALLPHVHFHLIGGLPGDIERQRHRAEEENLSNVFFHGHISQTRLPPHLWHADVLLLPPSADHPSAKWTSPLKLGEYMAAGVPCVSSDIPALRTWLSDSESLFFTADDPKALAGAVERLLREPTLGEALVREALLKAEELSYTRRAGRILEHPAVRGGTRAVPPDG